MKLRSLLLAWHKRRKKIQYKQKKKAIARLKRKLRMMEATSVKPAHCESVGTVIQRLQWLSAQGFCNASFVCPNSSAIWIWHYPSTPFHTNSCNFLFTTLVSHFISMNFIHSRMLFGFSIWVLLLLPLWLTGKLKCVIFNSKSNSISSTLLINWVLK